MREAASTGERALPGAGRRRARGKAADREAAAAVEAAAAAEAVEAAAEAPPERRRGRLRRWLARAEAAVMLGAGAAALAVVGAEAEAARSDGRVLPGVRVGGIEVGGMDAEALGAAVQAAAERGLERPLELRAGGARTTTTAAALGALPSPEAAVAGALALGRSGDPIADLQARAAAERGAIDLAIGYRFDEARALARLLELAPAVERPSLPTRFDFAAREVLPPTPGTSLLAHDSLSAVAVGLASGTGTIDLVVAEQPPVADPLAPLAGALDIREVLGTFSTPYSSDAAYADRTHNLKLGAAALDGHVLAPGETMSFNAVVGERSDQAGFRYAPGITAGELVDVVGGGTCQVSSTLYGAAFFAGLDLVEARPHSRPSAYVDMGLDSTVVDGMIDMKLRNPYEFPVVLHSAVRGGTVTIEVLGARRPYKVAFEREVKEVLPFTTTLRSDAGLRAGATAVAQQGKRGFRVLRRRILYTGDEVARTEEWELFYPPTTEILRRGTAPNGPLPTGGPPPKLRDPAPELRIVQ